MSTDGDDSNTEDTYRIADLILDIDAVRLWRGGEEIELPTLSFDLLVVMVRHAPAVVTFDQLMDEVWGDVVVNPETVTQRVKLVRDALGDDSASPRYIAPVRGRGYRLIPTPQPVHESAQPRAWQGIRAAAIVAGILGIAVVAWLTLDPPGASSGSGNVPVTDARAIAILPFANMSSDPDNEAIADGIHDDVLTQVARISSLRVISRTSVELLDRDLSIPEIAESLGVGTVLEGSVQRVGDNVRINVQLIDGSSDYHLWSQTYDRELNATNVFFIQSDIATRIADNDELSRLQTPPTEVFAAYEAYLLGRRNQRNRVTTELERSRAYFEQAIELDPDYAQAYLELARTLQMLSSYGTLPAAIAGDRAMALVTRALELDEQLGEAYAARGMLRTRRLEFDGAEADFRVAMRLAPNHPETHTGYADLLRFRNRTDEAVERFRVAQP